MAVRLQESFAQPQFTVGRPSWWNSSEQISQFSSKNISFKVESLTSPHGFREVKHLGLQFLDQESSSTQSIGQSHGSVSAVGRTDSQDQCFSSESGENEGRAKGAEGRMKPVFLLNPPDSSGNLSQSDHSHVARAPCPCDDAYYGGLFAAYGPQSMIQPQMIPQMMGIMGARIPLPLNLAYDGPIYVNAKQYHGILRRRQSRAKLEAQNKLVKTRKPYLHESRHRHALNRVRGSGGRFLSSKNLLQPNPSPTSGKHGVSEPFPLHQKNASLNIESHPGSGNSSTLGNPDHSFFIISKRANEGLQNSGGFVQGRNQHCASVIR